MSNSPFQPSRSTAPTHSPVQPSAPNPSPESYATSPNYADDRYTIRLTEAGMNTADPGAAVGHKVKITTQSIMVALFICALSKYGIRDGLMIGTLLGVSTGIGALLGFVPVLGPVAYWFMASRWTLPLVLSWLPTVHASWVTTAYLWTGLALSIFCSICSMMILYYSRR